MIQVKFGDGFVEVSGHAEYAEHGSDIVCSAVSAVTQLLAMQIAGFYEGKPGFMHINYDEADKALYGYQRFIMELEMQYPENIKVVVE